MNSLTRADSVVGWYALDDSSGSMSPRILGIGKYLNMSRPDKHTELFSSDCDLLEFVFLNAPLFTIEKTHRKTKEASIRRRNNATVYLD